MKKRPSCSRCGEVRFLSLITVPYDSNSKSGRVLVYCPSCQKDFKDRIGVIIPLEKVDEALFLELYRTGKTHSDPITATEIVFGEELPNLAKKANEIMKSEDESNHT